MVSPLHFEIVRHVVKQHEIFGKSFHEEGEFYDGSNKLREGRKENVSEFEPCDTDTNQIQSDTKSISSETNHFWDDRMKYRSFGTTKAGSDKIYMFVGPQPVHALNLFAFAVIIWREWESVRFLSILCC